MRRLNQWHRIHVSFEEGALGLDTNLDENIIRPTKLGMKNWMFSDSLEAETKNVLIYTLLANCRAQGIDHEGYLDEILKRLPHGATQGKAAALTPARLAAEHRAKAEGEKVAKLAAPQHPNGAPEGGMNSGRLLATAGLVALGFR